MMRVLCDDGYWWPVFEARRDRIVVMNGYNQFYRMTNILSPASRYKKFRYEEPAAPGSTKVAPVKVSQPPSMTFLVPKPGWYNPVLHPLFKVPVGPAPKAAKLSRKRRHSEVEGSNSYNTALMQTLAEGIIAKAGKNFKRQMQAVVPHNGVRCLQFAALVYMKIPFGIARPVPNSKCVFRVAPPPPPNRLISFLPAKAQKPAEDGFQFAFVWANGATWKLKNIKDNEKPRYKFCTKRAVRFRIGKRMPVIAEKNEDERFLQVEEWAQNLMEGRKKLCLKQLQWEQLRPEGDARGLEGAPQPGRPRLPQCSFYKRMYCSRRHTWLLRDFRSCPLCPNTYTAL